MQININNPHLASYTPDVNSGANPQVKTSQQGSNVSTAHIRPAPTAADTLVKMQMRNAFAAKFGKLAGDPKAFHAFTTKVFGGKYDQAKAESLRQRALAGDYSWLPKVEFQSRETLQGANGAYAKSKDTIYIADDLKSNPTLAGQTFIEEAGHAIDARINEKDAAGDEGEMFRRLLNGEKLSQSQVNEIRNENDHHTITVNGEKVETEFFFGKLKKAFKKVTKGVGGVFKKVANSVKSVAKKVISVPKKIFGAAKNVFSKVGGVFKKVLSFPKAIFGGVFNVAKNIFGNIGGIFSKILSFPKSILGGITGFARNLLGNIGGIFKNLLGTGFGIAKNVFGFAQRFLNPVGAITNTVNTITSLCGWGANQAQNLFSNVTGILSGFIR